MEKNKSQELISQMDIETDKTRNKVADILSWFFSNLFSLLFPVGAVFFIEIFEKSGTFDFKSNYSEMLMVAISMCTNLIIQLNNKTYKISESLNTLIRIITTGILVMSSLAYGISKTIPESELAITSVYKISKWLLIVSFVIGLICEIRKKESDRL